MVDLKVSTATGTDGVLAEEAIKEFKSGLRGELLGAEDDGYEDARKLWNGMIDKRPALIARCTGVSDVINAVNFARENHLLVAVRGGGHSFPGKSMCDGGIVIDLSTMRSVRVDPVRRTARAEGGAKLGDLDRETQAFGLATVAGTVSDTGIAGLTLGGGLGWLMRKNGLTCDHLLSADVVTADGRLVIASATENEDLYWGLRGGSGNFGIVTSFEYKVFPVGQVLGGMVIHPIDRAKDVMKFFDEFASTAPDELTMGLALLTSPEGQPAAAILACYSGPMEDAEKVVKPLREYGPPVADHLSPMPYVAMQSLLDEGVPAGNRYYLRSDFMKDLSGEAIDVIVDRFASVPSPYSVILNFHMGGAVSRVPRDETAFSYRDAVYDFEVISVWTDPADDEKNMSWTREFGDAMKPFASGGVYVNALEDEGEERVKEAYGTGYERLVALKNKYDPTDLFRLNQNIQPTV